jgi:uncharacterized protein (TIGR02594 family)
VNVTALGVARKFEGLRETPGLMDNPLVMAMLKLDQAWPSHDEVPWCSAFVNFVAHILGLPRSASLAARSWLRVGEDIPLSRAQPGFDVVVLMRGVGSQPGPDVISASGHVGFYAGRDGPSVLVLGGNQHNSVNVSPYPAGRVLGVRRLHVEEA